MCELLAMQSDVRLCSLALSLYDSVHGSRLEKEIPRLTLSVQGSHSYRDLTRFSVCSALHAAAQSAVSEHLGYSVDDLTVTIVRAGKCSELRKAGSRWRVA
jgi:hypothetical protein